jgi:hypothetical protein
MPEQEAPSDVAPLGRTPQWLDGKDAPAMLTAPQPPALEFISERLSQVVHRQAEAVNLARHGGALLGCRVVDFRPDAGGMR